MSVLLLFCSTLIHPLFVPDAQTLHAADREEQWQQQQFLASNAPAELRVKAQKEQAKPWAVGCLGVVPPLTQRTAVAVSENDALDTPSSHTGMLHTQMTASDL